MRSMGAQVVQDVFFQSPDAGRAARALANGDLSAAARHGGGAWQLLSEGKVVEALQEVQQQQLGPPEILLEAECLMAVGAVVAGLDLLKRLHEENDPNGTLLLARRHFLLGDYKNAERVGQSLPLHAHAVLTVARSAILGKRPRAALQALQPLLDGSEAIPDSAMAGSIILMAAACMVKSRSFKRLNTTARRLLVHPDLPQEMMPAVARIAWMGGLSATAWKRFSEENNPWAAAARIELALLSGDIDLARKSRDAAGTVGAPSIEGFRLLEGKVAEGDAGGEVFGKGYNVHIWRTHPSRWTPWIEAVKERNEDTSVFSLADGVMPERDDLPKVIVDDGSLLGMIAPRPVERRAEEGRRKGLWIDAPLVEPVGVGLDWPDEETEAAKGAAKMAKSEKSAAVVATSIERALLRVNEGLPTIAVAEPGDPFWLGPIPERAWKPLRVVRPDPKTGWQGAGERMAEFSRELEAA